MDSVLSTLTQCMADILLDGEAIELLDGEVAHSHVLWLTAVINEIENRKLIRIFKVSALGAQSCGKSTLLNTMFGLNFPVSTGRCTRGAYMQLVKIDENLAKQLQCDYLLVIDSEGLMSRVSRKEDYDNELATFVIGLSDLTLVSIKGEGKEMEDVLPIAFHVFLRMNVLGELQACHFVHQNMGAVDVGQTLLPEIDAFVKLLDEKTQAAAKEAGEQKYQRFMDTLHYDRNTDNTYVCHLWVGTPPMGRADREYSHTTQRLKTKILERVKHVTKVKGCSTLDDFSRWLQEIWEAVKYENFVFSFRNVLAMETYKRLSKIFNDKQWEMKKAMRQSIELTKKQIKDETLTKPEKETYRLKIQNMKKKTKQDVNSNIQILTKSIMHYFKCSGCTECSPEVRNRHFLKDYKSGFEHDIEIFEETLKEEINQSAENLRVELAASIDRNQQSSQMDDLIKKKLQDLIDEMMPQSLTEENKRESFDRLWTNVEEEILKKINPKEKKVNIKASVQSVITTLLGSDSHKYHRKKSDSRNKIGVKSFVAKDSHAARDNLSRLEERTEMIIEQATGYCRTVTEDKRYEAKDAEMLFNEIPLRIKQLEEEDIDTTLDYKVDLIICMEELAVRIFTLNQNKYEEQNSVPALLQKKKEIYYEVYVIKLGQRNSLVEMMNRFLKSIVRNNLEDRLTPTELMQILRNKGGEVFRNTQALQASIMVDLLARNTFEGYLRYITQYRDVIKETLTKRSIEILEGDNRLKLLAKSKLSSIIDELKSAIDRTVQNENNDFIGTLFSNMKGLKKPHDDMEAYKMVPFDDKEKFGSFLVTQLSLIQGQLEKDIDSSEVSNIIAEKGFTNFAFNEVEACTATCPLCKVPCDAHSGGKTSGKHRAILHRPRGLGGMVATDSRQLIAYNCNEGVASETAKLRTKAGQWINLKDYSDVYHDWIIEPSTDTDHEVFWKRVLRDFNEEFARHYKDKKEAKKADIPHWWYDISDHHVENDLVKNYGVSRDEIKQKLFEAKYKISEQVKYN